jgi:AGZA family xanthine/uracil permease-like MFS transporter
MATASTETGFRPRWFVRGDLDGFFGLALDNLFLLASMIWSSITVEVSERRFIRAALWALAASLLSLVGLMHSYAYTPADTVQDVAIGKSWPFTVAYLLLAGLLASGSLFKRDEATSHGS